MKRLRSGMLLVLTACLTAACARVGPDEVGVRTRNVAPGKGIVPEDQGPGYYRFLWPLDSWQRFPSTVQSIRFGHRPHRRVADDGPPLEVTSADGDRVTVSAEVMFRIADGSAHRVLQDSGSGARYREVARGLALDAARALLGRLRTEDFYNVSRREEVRAEMRVLLAQRLASRHMELVDFLLDTIEFAPDYEGLIRTKKVADQQVELERARSRAAEETGKVALVRTMTDVRLQALQREADIEMMKRRTDTDLQIAGLNADAEKYATERMADGFLVQGLKEAAGIRATRAAEAESLRLKNEALTGDGARNLVAQETVLGLNLPDMVISSDGYPWLSPHEMVETFGGERQKTPDETAP